MVQTGSCCEENKRKIGTENKLEPLCGLRVELVMINVDDRVEERPRLVI